MQNESRLNESRFPKDSFLNEPRFKKEARFLNYLGYLDWFPRNGE